LVSILHFIIEKNRDFLEKCRKELARALNGTIFLTQKFTNKSTFQEKFYVKKFLVKKFLVKKFLVKKFLVKKFLVKK